MRLFSGLAGLGISVVFVGSCWAATVDPLQGEVWINHGQGYQKVTGPLSAGVGDSVMVSPNGQARVSYPDGCKVVLEPLLVHSVGSLSPCASGSLAQQPTGPTTGTPDSNLGMYAVGAVVVGGGVAAGLLLTNKNNSPPGPVSP